MGGIVHIVKVPNDEFHLVLVSDGGCEGLELEFLYLLSFAVRNGFYDCIKVFLILWKDIDWLAIRIVVSDVWL